MYIFSVGESFKPKNYKNHAVTYSPYSLYRVPVFILTPCWHTAFAAAVTAVMSYCRCLSIVSIIGLLSNNNFLPNPTHYTSVPPILGITGRSSHYESHELLTMYHNYGEQEFKSQKLKPHPPNETVLVVCSCVGNDSKMTQGPN